MRKNHLVESEGGISIGGEGGLILENESNSQILCASIIAIFGFGSSIQPQNGEF